MRWQWHQLDHHMSFLPCSRQLIMPACYHSVCTAGSSNWLSQSTKGTQILTPSSSTKVVDIAVQIVTIYHSLRQVWSLNQESHAKNSSHMSISLCTTITHSAAWNSSDNLPSYPLYSHHCLNVVCWRKWHCSLSRPCLNKSTRHLRAARHMAKT